MPAAPPRRSSAAACALLTCACAWAYRPRLHAWWRRAPGAPPAPWTFLETWDDDTNLVDNDAIRFKESLRQWRTHASFWSLSAVRINVYEPLAWTLKSVVYACAGLSPLAFRVASLGLHLFGAVVFRATLLRLLPVCVTGNDSNARSAPQNQSHHHRRLIDSAALIGSMCYLLHPVAVEIVCWPSAQPYSLAGVFSMCALYCYVRYSGRDGGHGGGEGEGEGEGEGADDIGSTDVLAGLRRGVSHPWLLGAVLLSTASTLSKSAALLASPAGFLAIDIMRGHPAFRLPPRPRGLLAFAAERWLVGVSVIAMLAVTLVANEGGTQDDIDTITITPAQRLFRAPMLFLKALRDMSWPAELRAHYAFQSWMVDPAASPACLLSLVGVPATLMAAAALHRVVLGLWVWHALTVLPTLGLVQHGMVVLGGDRYLYLPLVPFATGVALCCCYLDAPARTSDPTGGRSRRRWAGRAGVSLFVVGFGLVTRLLVPHWRNDETVWRWAITVDPADWRATDQLVEHYVGQMRWDEAEPLLPRVQMFSPKSGLKAELHRAKILIMQGATDEACRVYSEIAAEERFRTSPARGGIYNNYGVCMLHRNDQPVAKSWFEEGLQQTTNSRHRATLTRNLQELRDNWSQSPGKRYQGQHSLIF